MIWRSDMSEAAKEKYRAWRRAYYNKNPQRFRNYRAKHLSKPEARAHYNEMARERMRRYTIKKRMHAEQS